MARICTLCGKGPQVINNRPHSMTVTKRKQAVNLQWAKVDGKRMKICTKCLKGLHK